MFASQQVLQRVVQLLLAGPTAAGDRVYSDRAHPVADVPAIKVHLRDEDLQADEAEDITWPPVRLHRLQLEVQLLVQAVTGMDAALAAFELQAYRVLQGTLAGATLQPLAGCNLTVQGIRRQPTTDGQAAHATSTLRCEVLFRTRANNPETLI